MHVITGEIRKEPFVKQGQNGTLYIVELSESYKDREGNRQYTNYKFFFNAKSEGMNNWYREAFQQGKIISVSCDQLRIDSSEYNGQIYNTLTSAGFANLQFSQRGGQQQAPQQQSQPRQQQQPRQQAPQNNEPPMDFDDDIPF
ncbi:single strand DNA binding protein [Salmonella phage 36]|uniref:Single-stranded DNA binding protein n=2 Tax=Tlsvirus TaxID=1920865 RepID=A0AAE8AZX8_9CAUD|nr:single strand DNA binding protein [Salmonella phage 36]AKJ74023.1 putative single-strand DNA-binding protein [Salmonella phage 36]QXV77401.1 single-stranded DNA binding protein [Escherichia phage DanielBernoulli]